MGFDSPIRLTSEVGHHMGGGVCDKQLRCLKCFHGSLSVGHGSFILLHQAYSRRRVYIRHTADDECTSGIQPTTSMHQAYSRRRVYIRHTADDLRQAYCWHGLAFSRRLSVELATQLAPSALGVGSSEQLKQRVVLVELATRPAPSARRLAPQSSRSLPSTNP